MGFTPYVAPNNAGRDLDVNAFGSSGGGTASQTVISQFDFYSPNKFLQVFERHNYSPGFRLQLKTFGFKRGTAAPTTGHYEYPQKSNLVHIGAIITPSTGPNTNVVVELDPSAMYNTNVTSNGQARQASYPRQGFMLKMPDGNKAYILSKDVSVTPHRLTLQPTSASYDLATSVVAGARYFISDTAWAEGTGLPTGLTNRVIVYENTFQIVKDQWSATGSSMTNKLYYHPVPNMPGAKYLKMDNDTMYRFEDMCDGALIWGENNSNIEVYVQSLGHDAPLTGTEGLIKYVTTNTYQDIYIPGGYTMVDFDLLAKYYNDERVGMKTLIHWQGFEFYQEIENLIFGLHANDTEKFLVKQMLGLGAGASPDDAQLVAEDDWVMNIGFKALKKSGFTHCFKQLAKFSEAIGAGAAGYNYPQWNIVMPLGMTMNKKTNTTVPTVGYEFKQLGKYSRENVIGNFQGIGVGGTGGFVPDASHASDTYTLGMVSEIAFHAAVPNAVVTQKP